MEKKQTNVLMDDGFRECLPSICLVSLRTIFAVAVITTSYFSVGFSFLVFVCVSSLFLCNKRKEEEKKK